jgi:hypothetical protein
MKIRTFGRVLVNVKLVAIQSSNINERANDVAATSGPLNSVEFSGHERRFTTTKSVESNAIHRSRDPRQSIVVIFAKCISVVARQSSGYSSQYHGE